MSEFTHEQLSMTGVPPPSTTSDNAFQSRVPTTNDSSATAQAKLNSAKDSIVSTAQSTFDSVQNHPTVQSIVNGPVAQNAKQQASLTQDEFRNLANSTTDEKAATGQPLTHYHSMFYTLLTWQNPRATGIVFSSTIVFIFMTRYLNILHYFLRFSYFVLGITAGLEVIGKVLFDDGLTSKMRPRKYWTVPKESIAASVDEIEQLLNFFVIEAQRIVYAENIYATIAVFFAALLSYGLIKLIPFWGLSLIATSTMFLAPLVYIQNREVIDHQVENVTHMVNTNASQLKDISVHHANQAYATAKTYTDEYTNKAQEYIGRRQSTAQGTTTGSSSTNGLSSAQRSTGSAGTSGITATSGIQTGTPSASASGGLQGTTGPSATSGFQSTTSGSGLNFSHSDNQAYGSSGLSGSSGLGSASDFPAAPRQDPYPSAPLSEPQTSFAQQLQAERDAQVLH